jgi:hypothetical protein
MLFVVERRKKIKMLLFSLFLIVLSTASGEIYVTKVNKTSAMVHFNWANSFHLWDGDHVNYEVEVKKNGILSQTLKLDQLPLRLYLYSLEENQSYEVSIRSYISIHANGKWIYDITLETMYDKFETIQPKANVYTVYHLNFPNTIYMVAMVKVCKPYNFQARFLLQPSELPISDWIKLPRDGMISREITYHPVLDYFNLTVELKSPYEQFIIW